MIKPFLTWRRPACLHLLMMLSIVYSQPAWAGFFLGLGDLPGGDTSSNALAISADGSTVVGSSTTSQGIEAFRWSPTEGLRSLGDLPGGVTSSVARGVSADGSIIVGYGMSTSGMEAFRWSSDQGLTSLSEQLGDLGFRSSASAVSADGKTIIGTGNYSAGGGPAPVTGTAFVWSANGGVQRLQDIPGNTDCSRATDLTPDATIIVGIGNCDASFQVEDLGTAVRFHTDGPATSIDAKPATDHRSFAYAVSSNGVVVGAQELGESRFGHVIATRWLTDGTSQSLTAQDVAFSSAQDVSADGQVVVGQWNVVGTQSTAFYWDDIRGALDFRQLLISFGYKEVNDWKLETANAVSADGRTITGSAINPSGQAEAWVAQLTLKKAGDFNFDGNVDATDVDRLAEEIRDGRQDLPFDTNGDRIVNEMDRVHWVVGIAHTYFGDADLDATFSSEDLIQVFQAGEYEDQVVRNSSWQDGDWDGNGDFESSDLIMAFQQGGYEKGPLPNVVPEMTMTLTWQFTLLLPLLADVDRRMDLWFVNVFGEKQFIRTRNGA